MKEMRRKNEPFFLQALHGKIEIANRFRIITAKFRKPDILLSNIQPDWQTIVGNKNLPFFKAKKKGQKLT